MSLIRIPLLRQKREEELRQLINLMNQLADDQMTDEKEKKNQMSKLEAQISHTYEKYHALIHQQMETARQSILTKLNDQGRSQEAEREWILLEQEKEAYEYDVLSEALSLGGLSAEQEQAISIRLKQLEGKAGM